jgi:predicted MPP superfamily phosphohydrolase
MEHFLSLNACISGFLAACGMSAKGLENVMDVRVEENEVFLPGLPKPFEGFRLLQLADLHCDLDVRIMERIRDVMAGVSHDAVVLTGDYQNKVHLPFDQSLLEMRRLIRDLHPIRFAVLGNHDFLEMVAPLEAEGLPFLLNESLPLKHHDARLWICGIDDPHFFRTHDLQRARSEVPASEPAILLSHSPETFREAASLGYSLMLSGHTHGGQMCLPGGIPVYRNAPGCRREHLAGSWREGTMLGYTSRGSGTAGVAARFHCPPEITVHILKSPLPFAL